MSRANETRHIEWHETHKCKYRVEQVFVAINNIRMKIYADMNAKNWLTKVYAVRDLFGIQVIVSVNVINHVILVSI